MPDARTTSKIFGYAKIAHKNLVQVFLPEIGPACQLSFVLGKLLPMEVDLWVSKDEIPSEIPSDWLPLSVTPLEGEWKEAEGVIAPDLSNRTKGWLTAARLVVHKYLQKYGGGLEAVEVIEDIPTGPERPEETTNS